MAGAEDAGDYYWQRRQAQAAEELGREAAARMAELQRLLPAVPGLQAGMTREEVAAFRQDLETNGLPEIERDFLLGQGWTQAELDALVQSMLDTADEIYQMRGLQADATVLADAGARVQTVNAADIADTPSSLLELPATQIIPSGTLGRDGKYVSDVLIALEATSPTAVAIAAIEYRLDEGTTWGAYTEPFTICEDGVAIILARATDDLGRTEDPPARRVIAKRPSVFGDVPADSWAWDAVESCYWSGIVQGYPEGDYKPELAVTRDQMAAYISRALAGGDGNVREFTGEPTFPDVPDDHWAFDHIEYAVAQNVVEGYPEGDYKPEVEVTRDQMAVYVARSLVAPTGDAGLADYTPPDEATFPDVPNTGYGADGTEPYWAYKHIEFCVENNVVQGYPEGDYRPEVVITREQMAVYVARAFELPL